MPGVKEVTELPVITVDVPGRDFGHVHLTTALLQVPPVERSRLALQVIHLAAQQATGRGSRATLQRCYDHAIDNDLVFRWNGSWSASPDRSRAARPTYRLDPADGWGRVALEIRDGDGDTPTVTSGEAVAFCTLEGFRRSAQTMRWSGPDSVEVVPYAGLVGQQAGRLIVRRESGAWSSAVTDDVHVRVPDLDLTSRPPVIDVVDA
ncbi:hypothetical protein [Nocardioides plantarum]|uniref:Uncharacterized protein n=2 Tax=Nocardioides plantarum TaxID=29299 RepID=A0ABV5K9Z0_9ACTN|nr:hypothetical protein [Nocardioides plantarum]